MMAKNSICFLFLLESEKEFPSIFLLIPEKTEQSRAIFVCCAREANDRDFGGEEITFWFVSVVSVLSKTSSGSDGNPRNSEKWKFVK